MPLARSTGREIFFSYSLIFFRKIAYPFGLPLKYSSNAACVMPATAKSCFFICSGDAQKISPISASPVNIFTGDEE